ncbi:MAG: hypothetical protein Q8912_12470 [Bacillota bacterium]|nr:hypothetical protein [Bacillota bacterium]
MKYFSKLEKFLRSPHKAKIDQLKGRYQELDELSNVAVEIEDAVAYRSIQVEMKEVFFDYLTAVVVDSVYKLVPHVLIIWVISLRWQNITVPIVNWKVNILAAYLLSYFIFNLGQLLINPIRAWLSKFREYLFSGHSIAKKI